MGPYHYSCFPVKPDTNGNLIYVSVNRGFVGVDATIGDHVYRVVNTSGNPIGSGSTVVAAAHSIIPGKPKGYTCCQDPDLRNELSTHHRRVDMVFADPPPSQVKAKVLDDELSDKIDTGFGTPIWPSNHSGVSVRLKYAN